MRPQTLRVEGHEEAPPLFPEPGSFPQKSGMEARERNRMLAATRDLVEQAMKIQFPDDEIRNHDDRTGKYHNNILEVPSTRTTIT